MQRMKVDQALFISLICSEADGLTLTFYLLCSLYQNRNFVVCKRNLLWFSIITTFFL